MAEYSRFCASIVPERTVGPARALHAPPRPDVPVLPQLAGLAVPLEGLQCRVEDGRGERREVQLQLRVRGVLLLVAVIDVTPCRGAEMVQSITVAIHVGTDTMVMTPDRPERARARENPLDAFACVSPDDYEEWLRLNAEAFAAKRPFRGECRLVVHGATPPIGDSGPGIAEAVIAGLPRITTVDNHGSVLHFGASPLGGAKVLVAFPPLPTP